MTRSAADRIDENWESRQDDLRLILAAEGRDVDTYEKYNLPPMNEYGLSFDYVEPETFPEQDEGYFRFQMSWGGPSDEFRFYDDGARIEYWFMDWFDGAMLDVSDDPVAKDVWEWFSAYAEAVREGER